jgi:hypothetical protein
MTPKQIAKLKKQLLTITDLLTKANQVIEHNKRLEDELAWRDAYLTYFSIDLKGKSPVSWQGRKNHEFTKLMTAFSTGKMSICYGDSFYIRPSARTDTPESRILTREALETYLNGIEP